MNSYYRILLISCILWLIFALLMTFVLRGDW
jgi:hypothetical protein